MQRKTYHVLAVLFLLMSTCGVQATTSEYTDFYIPYQRIQSSYICLDKQIMKAEFGIPLASMAAGIFAPTRTIRQRGGAPLSYTNINLLHPNNTQIPVTLNFDRFHPSGVTDYSFTLDLGALSALHGGNVSGRQQTINTAKLAVIALVKTAESLHGVGKFRLWLKFNNLPASSGLSGHPLFIGSADWPGWPFTSASSLYQAYLNEMIAPDC